MDGDNQWRIIRTSQQAYFMPGCTCAGARASGRVESERDVCLADGEWFTSLSFRSKAPHTHMWPFLRRSTLDAHPERLIGPSKVCSLCRMSCSSVPREREAQRALSRRRDGNSILFTSLTSIIFISYDLTSPGGRNMRTRGRAAPPGPRQQDRTMARVHAARACVPDEHCWQPIPLQAGIG